MKERSTKSANNEKADDSDEEAGPPIPADLNMVCLHFIYTVGSNIRQSISVTGCGGRLILGQHTIFVGVMLPCSERTMLLMKLFNAENFIVIDLLLSSVKKQ